MKYESLKIKQNLIEKIFIFFLSFPVIYYCQGRYMYIDIKSIKLFDCLQCLSFPSMRENDKIRLISMFNLFC